MADQQQYPNLNPYSKFDGSNDTANVQSNVGGQSNMTEQAKGTANNLMNSKYQQISPPNIPQKQVPPNMSLISDAQSAMDSVKNSQTVQNIQNGPVADKARAETAAVNNEFSNLANSRQTPNTQTATGQPLTHYHSMFYTLLSWENPRATAISYAAIVLAIFAFRYLPIVRYSLRLTWIVLGITAAAEVAGRVAFGQGMATKMRPKQYYTIPRETLDSMIGDLEQLVNFFVIEFQRILFAENISATIGAFASALTTYFLIKVTPAWGLALLFTTVIYFVPLIYISNKELIDSHLENAGKIVNEQTQQVRDLASQHTSKAMEASQQTFKQYSARASEMVGQTKEKAVQQGVAAKEQAVNQGIISPETADRTEESLRSAPSAPATELPGHAQDAMQAEHRTAEPVLQ
ncbi:hypothetical protein LTS14_007818 [Recurvomyces mirabilis]|uniref:uncharacterized protein n=1 Tax=Recurvomyces mirabilis TaxID=574656 RepID=UPI002DE0BE95|nr:hypothetical protein LTS14_007818 [Recurvomyces mirabilis]